MSVSTPVHLVRVASVRSPTDDVISRFPALLGAQNRRSVRWRKNGKAADTSRSLTWSLRPSNGSAESPGYDDIIGAIVSQ